MKGGWVFLILAVKAEFTLTTERGWPGGVGGGGVGRPQISILQ
jgi:hypothetical protein